MPQQTTKDIDQRTKDLVFGFIHLSNLQSTIPTEICYLCLLFYYLIPERFVLCGDGLQISSSDENNGKVDDIIKIVIETKSWKWVLAHANMIINPKDNPDIIVEWTIKCDMEFVIIGIHQSYDEDYVKYKWYGVGDFNYNFAKGDEIKMVFDATKQKLIFYKNGELSKKEVNNIDISKQYHLLIKVFYDYEEPESGTVQLLDCNVTGGNSLSFHSNK